MDEKQVVGRVTYRESEDIRKIFERRNSLEELLMIMPSDNDSLYERVIKDVADTNRKFDDWWDRMTEKYHWESADGGHWEIDFDTCEIFLVTQQ